jgi:hypothetical protein
MRLLRASLVFAALLAAGPAVHAQSAYDYPWCALYGGRDGPGATSCYYATREQCMATLSGIGGTCIRSPYYGHGPRSERQPRRDRRDY